MTIPEPNALGDKNGARGVSISRESSGTPSWIRAHHLFYGYVFHAVVVGKFVLLPLQQFDFSNVRWNNIGNGDKQDAKLVP
jgi:hypothetical protein